MQVFTSLVVLSIFIGVFVITDIRNYKQRKIDSMTSLAHVIGTNSISTLRFQDNESARSILSELRSSAPEIVHAGIFDKSGKLFAVYARQNDSFLIPPVLGNRGFLFFDKHLFVTDAITEGTEKLGRIVLEVELSELTQITRSVYRMATILLLVALCFSFLIAIAVQVYISKRLLRLVAKMKEVSKTGNYSQPMAEDGKDEISILIRVYNGLMQQVKENQESSKEQSILLEEKVKRRTSELREMNLVLQQSNNDLQQFAHVASHDLQEPLRKFKIFLGRLASDPDTSLSENSTVYYEKANSASDRMFSMIEGVLNYSMVNSTEQKMELVRLNDIICEIEKDLELLIVEKSANIQFQDLPDIQGSPFLLYQLFYNLMNNSLKFSKPSVPPLIRIQSSFYDEGPVKMTEIRLSDNGIGFEPEQASEIFNPFTRLHSKSSYEGTGLGLSLCKRIVQRHGGHISAQGIPNEGAVFIVQLPLFQDLEKV
jgi:signal transduction histidine kinase